jgi:hypothetical protein
MRNQSSVQVVCAEYEGPLTGSQLALTSWANERAEISDRRGTDINSELRTMQWDFLKAWRLLSLDEVRSVRSGPKYKIEEGSFGERSEVPVSREERHTSVDTALGNQRVAKACLAALCKHLRSQPSCSLPIARSVLEQRHFGERFGNAGR